MKNKNRFLILIAFMCNSLVAENLPSDMFDEFWRTAEKKIYPKELAEKYFTKDVYDELKKKTVEAKDIYELTPIINSFLSEIPVSHTHFYDSHSIDFYLFRSMFGTKEINHPVVNHIGAQFIELDDAYVITDVLSGYPAEQIGLRRGDKVITANQSDFHPYHSFNPKGKKIRLTVLRGNQKKYFVVSAVRENPNLSMNRSIGKSIKVYEENGKRLGYIRLWSGTHKSNLDVFRESFGKLGEIDGLILDLRGGYGGAWYDYLDLFFPDRKNYFHFTISNRDGTKRYEPDQKDNERYYMGPMVVLINEGTRSGKEALAYQFQKSHRALLVGVTTKGAFSAGEGIFNESDMPFFLYLATAEYQLNGTKIEGVGVNPDISIEYDLSTSLAGDPQLDTAIKEISKKIVNADKIQ